MKISLYRIIFFTLAILIGQKMQAIDSGGKADYSFRRIAELYPWLCSANPAGLVTKDFNDFSQVRLSIENIDGSYKNYDDPANFFSSSVNTRSFVRRGNFYLMGNFDFTHFDKTAQAWSGTIHSRDVINMLTDSIPGRVLGESYRMSGAAGYRINKIFSAGIGFNYETSTAAKRVDGRNKNVLSSFEIRSAIKITGDKFTGGLNLLYQYKAEFSDYIFLGDNSGKHIYNFQGGWMYIKESITNSSVLDRGYFSDYYGGALQLSYGSGNFRIFTEFDIKYKAEDNYDDFNLLRRYASTEGLFYSLILKAVYNTNISRHSLQLNFNCEERLSYKIENQYEPVPNEVNTWNWFEYGKTLRYYDAGRRYRAVYTLELGENKWNPRWSFSLSGNLIDFNSEFIVYPALYSQKYCFGGADLAISRHFRAGKFNLIDISLVAGNYKGKGDMLTVQNPVMTGVLTIASSLMEEDFFYNTSGRVLLGGGLRYRRTVNEDKGTTLFIDAGIRQFQRKGLSRTYLNINLGLNF